MTRRKPKPATAVTHATVHPEAATPEFAPTVTDLLPPTDHSPAVPAHRPPDEHPTGDHPEGETSHVVAHRPEGPRVPNPFGHRQDAVAGVRLLEDRRFKQVQLKFADKPSEEVRRVMSEAGFRWLQVEQAWAKQIGKENGWQTRAEAEDLFGRVTAMIREAKGVTHAHG